MKSKPRKTIPVTLDEVKRILKEWAEEEHNNVCAAGPWTSGLLCRHDRARTALTQIENVEFVVLGDRES